VRRHVVPILALALLSGVWAASGAGATARSQVRGFDGSTIKVAGIGIASQTGNSQYGAQARIKRFNDDNEIKGIKFEYAGYADDKADPATALSEARRLVTQEQVFAIVGDTSQHNPYEFFVQNKVPFFGWGFEPAYCAPKITTDWWGFGYSGCQVQPAPKIVPDLGRLLYNYSSEKLGKKNPTLALLANDTATGQTTLNITTVAYEGRGFDLVYGKASVPMPPVGDYTPYVQELITADNGQQPDVIRCMMGTECLTIFTQLKTQGYTGIFNHSLYTDVLVKPFEGTTVYQSNNSTDATGIPALDQMKADLEAFKPGHKIDSATIVGYGSTDMLIQALKKVAKNGKSAINPTNIQKVAAKQTWQMKDFIGPIIFPTAFNRQLPYCTALGESDGTKWNIVEEFSCSNKTYPYKEPK
jgi:ABC-type branched-subunit amino acid transport system substrate-binding protein